MFTRILVAGLIVLASSGCGDLPSPKNDGELFASLPLEQYRVGGERLHKIRHAEARLVSDCMKRRGVAWNPPPISARDATPEFRRYGVNHIEIAKLIGYRAPVDPARERRNRYFLQEISAEQDKALSGCVVETNARLEQNSLDIKGMLVARLSQQSLRESRQVEVVRTAIAAWRECMRARNFDYADPDAAALDKAWRTSRPSKREINVATADASCKQDVRLAEIWTEAEAKIQRKLIERHNRDLNTVREANGRVLAQAAKVLG